MFSFPFEVLYVTLTILIKQINSCMNSQLKTSFKSTSASIQILEIFQVKKKFKCEVQKSLFYPDLTCTMMTSKRSLQRSPTMKDIPLSTVSKGELVITNSCFPASTNLRSSHMTQSACHNSRRFLKISRNILNAAQWIAYSRIKFINCILFSLYIKKKHHLSLTYILSRTDSLMQKYCTA